MRPPLHLARGNVEVALASDKGAALLYLRIGGRDILRPTPDNALSDPRGPLEMACFPLVPYANRIANGRFVFGERAHHVPLNFGDHPHSLHGAGWTAPWTIEETGEDSALLSHSHDGGASWPWPYRAEQRLTLTADGILLSLRLENRSNEPMPGGLGFHPYFLLRPDMNLRFGSEGVWLSTPDLIPDQLAPADALGDWGASADVEGEALIDNCYAGWSGEATITNGQGQRIRLISRGASFLHVYRPAGENFFCLEPVTHMPNAVNRPEAMLAMDVLAPGESLALEMAILAA